MASAAEPMAGQESPLIYSRDVQEEVAISNRYYTMPPKLDHKVYVATALLVMAAYALLLLINTRYINIVVIPATMVFFIGALWGKFWVMEGLQHGNIDTAYTLDNDIAYTLDKDTKKVERLPTVVLFPYWLLLIQVDLTLPTSKQQNDDLVVSHFLLFFSCAIGALAMLMAKVPIVTSPGLAQAQQALHRVFIVVLMITVHTMATEWMREDMVLVCMPELVAVLVWFTIYFDHARCTLSVDKVTSWKSSVICLSAAMALMAYHTSKFASEKKVLSVDVNYEKLPAKLHSVDVNYEKLPAKYWYTWVLCSCTLSGVLSYFSVWMIHQWPGSTDNGKVPIQLLRFSANICFVISAIVWFLEV